MKMSKKLLVILILVLALLALLNRRSLSDKMAEVGIEMAKRQVSQASVIRFHYGKVDSLYKEKAYSHFLFLKDSVGADDGLSAFLRRQPVLLIACRAIPDWLKDSGADTLRLPQSAFDFLVDEDKEMQAYQIVEVERRGSDNAYRLRKVDCYE